MSRLSLRVPAVLGLYRQQRSRAVVRARRRLVAVGMIATVLVVVSASVSSGAIAATPAPHWSLSSIAQPTNFSASDPEGIDRYNLLATNVGGSATTAPTEIVDHIPAAVQPTSVQLEELEPNSSSASCVIEGNVVTCIDESPVPARNHLEVAIEVKVVSQQSTPLVNDVAIRGGGAPEGTATDTTSLNSGPASFGLSQFALQPTSVDGQPEEQAGAHPYDLTTTMSFNTVLNATSSEAGVGGDAYEPVREVKTVAVTLPPGLYGDPLATPRCPISGLSEARESQARFTLLSNCPPASQVGEVYLVRRSQYQRGGYALYNMDPEAGYPAELGFDAQGLASPVLIYASLLPSAEGYRLRLATPGVLRAIQIEGLQITVFGDPGERDRTGVTAPFLTNPAACSEQSLKSLTEVSAWESGFFTEGEAVSYQDVSGCGALQGAAGFNPTLQVTPEESEADTPSGYEVSLKVPQAPATFAQLATPDLRDATVALPAGVSLSPTAASGPDALEGCSSAQIDLLGTELGEGHPGGNASPYDDGLTHASPGHCPEASRIGSVEVKTPLLEKPLTGSVYVAQPGCGGSGQPACTEQAAEEGQIFGLYLEMSGSGLIVKLQGSMEVGGNGHRNGLAPGQLRARFLNNPQLPFEELKMVISGGQRAALANPQSCGTYTTTSELEPWSAPESGPSATPTSAFAIAGCASPTGFTPALTAGTTTPLAGSYSPFTLTMTRKDGEQDLSSVAVRTPPGLLGKIAGIPLCAEAQANAGTCGPESQVGTTTVASGSGSEPLYLRGNVYLTGPYDGAPFGLSIAVPAVAGPFNLGNVVVRASIAIDPHTAAITTTSGPLPQFVDGVPTRIQTINVTLNRPGFIANPTNCEQQIVSATITSAQGATAGVSSPFVAAGCASLPFKPGFAVSTSGKASKADGASLKVKIVSPAEGPQNSSNGSSGSNLEEANIKSVKVELPKQLPSRLTTLQKACTAQQFDSNPAGCPSASMVGMATARTPILNGPLTGPAYFVSHGNEAFPQLVIVLQGENGLVVDLVGDTFISKAGITSSTFAAVPDVPVSSFELVLPEGPYSALTTDLPHESHDLCGQKLTMPTVFVAQNGAELHETTSVPVEGCSNALRVVSKSVKGKTATIEVSVPSAGKLVATGNGLIKASKTSRGATTLTVKLSLTKGKVAFLNKHQARRLKAKVDLIFTPKKGTKLNTSTTVLVG
jgi:hypothetical protein